MLDIILKSSQVTTTEGVTEKLYLRGSGKNKIDLGIQGSPADLYEVKASMNSYIQDYLQLKKRGY